jgi:uncharacterized protein (TIGR03437 family)
MGRKVSLMLVACDIAFGGTLIVPNVAGPGNGPGHPSGSRFQVVYGSGQFPGAITIAAIRFRAVPNMGDVNLNYDTPLKITLSTTQVFANTANGNSLPSLTFADNTGPDATVVFSASITLSSPGCGGSSACGFDMVVPLTKPFSFDPGKGRLLVDMEFPDTPGDGALDGIIFSDSATSSVIEIKGDLGQATGRLITAGFILGLDTTSPLISSVQNAASNIVPGLPNSAIAQGSIFVLQGTNMGPSTISVSTSGFQPSLSGTSAAVTMGGTVIPTPIYYTSSGQVAALLPSNTPAGTGTITVTYDNQQSPPVQINVVANNVGIFTIDSSGTGPGLITYADYSLVSQSKASSCGGPNTTCGAANAGDTLILWATGLGSVNGSDLSGAGLGQNMPDLPLKLFLGGVQAQVVYQGRSGCCIGLDQIAFSVPDSVPSGCAVPLVVQINDVVSNTIAVPVANGSRDCTTADPIASKIDPSILAGTRPLALAEVDMGRFINSSRTAVEDDIRFQFSKVTLKPALAPFVASFLDLDPPVDLCLVRPGATGNPSRISLGSVADTTVPLDAGSNFTIKAPFGTMTVPTNNGNLETVSAAGSLYTPGNYTITGSGGKDVGPLSIATILPPVAVISTPAFSPGFVVTRSSGLTITWTNGIASGAVRVEVGNVANNGAGARVICQASATSGSLTVPPYALLAIPPGPNAYVLVQQQVTNVSFRGLGLDYGVVNSYGSSTGEGGLNLQ